MYAIRSYYVWKLPVKVWVPEPLVIVPKLPATALVVPVTERLYVVFVITSYSIHYTKLYDVAPVKVEVAEEAVKLAIWKFPVKVWVPVVLVIVPLFPWIVLVVPRNNFV